MNPVEELIRQHQRKKALTFQLAVANLSEAGVRVMLTKLLGLGDDAIDNWSVIGPLIEAHRITLDFSDEDHLWLAACGGDVIEINVPGRNPRLAVGRLLIARQIDSDRDNAYSISVPYRVAVEFGHEHQPDEDGVIPGPDEKVVVNLVTQIY